MRASSSRLHRMPRLLTLAGILVAGAALLPGCAPLTKGLAAMNGGGTGGSTCEFSGLMRGDDCADAIAYVYLSNKDRPKPKVCASITSWSALGAKTVQAGAQCLPALPEYCRSDLLLPGFANEQVQQKGAQNTAEYAKEMLCRQAMSADVSVWEARAGGGSDQVLVWSSARMVDEYGYTQHISLPGEPAAIYCGNSKVLIPGLTEETLKVYGAYEQANKKKNEFCVEYGRKVAREAMIESTESAKTPG